MRPRTYRSSTNHGKEPAHVKRTMMNAKSLVPADDAEVSTVRANHRDENVRPQDDLYRHANGSWLSTAQIPADQGTYGSFMALRDDSEAAVRAIIEAAQEEIRQ